MMLPLALPGLLEPAPPVRPGSQLALPLAWPADPGDDAFVVTRSNEDAARQLARPEAWPVHAALLVGPRKSGRSLLARIVAARSGGRIIDDAGSRPEAELFHAWNRAQEEGRPLVIVADAAPPAWPVRLPDLRSRLNASPLAAIGAPDDELIRALLERQFLRRGLDARGDLLDWLAARLERSHLAVLRAADLLDEAALAERRRLTLPLARACLTGTGLIADSQPA